jgi:hypothetical protein
MKYLNIVKTVVAVFLVLHISGCGKDDPKPAGPTANEATEKLLTAKSWQISEVKVDGVISDLYPGLTIAFGSKTFTATNGGPVWPASGTWNFVGESGTKLLRNDGLDITIENISSTQLIILFSWNSSTFTNGRAGSLKGSHRMTFR